MFDYQAGERYKMTLIMTAIAGAMGGVFFTAILAPAGPSEAPRKQRPKWMDNPDVTGVPRGVAPQDGAVGQQAPSANFVPVEEAEETVRNWLPLAWDFSAGSCTASQDRAIQFMTPECAQNYRQSVWTTDLAMQVEGAGLKNQFQLHKMSAGPNNPDGSIVIFVEGEQVLSVPGQEPLRKPVNMEYIVCRTPEGLRISGISDRLRHN
jgi:hypothetical protein